MRYPQFFRATEAYPPLGLFPGDVVRYDPTSARTLEVYRRLPPNHGSLLNAIELGVVTPCGGDLLVSQLDREVPAGDPPPPQTPHLRLIRTGGAA
jgi:hypothetical protein